MRKKDIMRVIEAWSSPDDWNVPSIYANTVESLLDALEAGIAPDAIARHAKHTGKSRGICRVIDSVMNESSARRAEAINATRKAERLAYLDQHPLDSNHSESCAECTAAMDRAERLADEYARHDEPPFGSFPEER
jgi:hypothetical protein